MQIFDEELDFYFLNEEEIIHTRFSWSSHVTKIGNNIEQSIRFINEIDKNHKSSSKQNLSMHFNLLITVSTTHLASLFNFSCDKDSYTELLKHCPGF